MSTVLRTTVRSTKHMINAEKLALMKPTAAIINTCGGVIDEDALYDALVESLAVQ